MRKLIFLLIPTLRKRCDGPRQSWRGCSLLGHGGGETFGRRHGSMRSTVQLQYEAAHTGLGAGRPPRRGISQHIAGRVAASRSRSRPCRAELRPFAQRKGAPPPPRAPPHRPLESWPRGARLRVQMAAAGRGSANRRPLPPPTRLEMSGSPPRARIGPEIRNQAPGPGRVPHCGREGSGASEPGVLPRS